MVPKTVIIDAIRNSLREVMTLSRCLRREPVGMIITMVTLVEPAMSLSGATLHLKVQKLGFRRKRWMIASVDHKFVLLCNEKTATTSFEAAYNKYAHFKVGNKPSWKHINYRRYKEIFGDFFEKSGCDVFVVVRHPISTLLSWYNFRSREALAGSSVHTGQISFEQFAAEWSQPNPSPFAKVPDFRYFCMTTDGKLAPMKYYRYEDIAKLNTVLSNKVGVAVDLPLKNKSPSNSSVQDTEFLKETPRMAKLIDLYDTIKFE